MHDTRGLNVAPRHALRVLGEGQKVKHIGFTCKKRTDMTRDDFFFHILIPLPPCVFHFHFHNIAPNSSLLFIRFFPAPISFSISIFLVFWVPVPNVWTAKGSKIKSGYRDISGGRTILTFARSAVSAFWQVIHSTRVYSVK